MHPANIPYLAIVIALFLMCSNIVLASPVKLSSSSTVDNKEFFSLGPAPYAELQKRVAAFKQTHDLGSLQGRQLNSPLCRLSGVTWCEHVNFGGECFWGAFSGCTEITPDSWWRDRISSVRPDDNIVCVFRSVKGAEQTFVPPGADCRSYLNDQVLNFTCKLII